MGKRWHRDTPWRSPAAALMLSYKLRGEKWAHQHFQLPSHEVHIYATDNLRAVGSPEDGWLPSLLSYFVSKPDANASQFAPDAPYQGLECCAEPILTQDDVMWERRQR